MTKEYNEYDLFNANWVKEIESLNPSGQSQGNKEVDNYKTNSLWEVLKDILQW